MADGCGGGMYARVWMVRIGMDGPLRFELPEGWLAWCGEVGALGLMNNGNVDQPGREECER